MATDTETTEDVDQHLDQLRVLLRSLKAQFGDEILNREVRLILGETAGGSALIQGSDRFDLMIEAAAKERDREAHRTSSGQRGQAAWEKALERASGGSSREQGQGRDSRSQAEFDRVKRLLGG